MAYTQSVEYRFGTIGEMESNLLRVHEGSRLQLFKESSGVFTWRADCTVHSLIGDEDGANGGCRFAYGSECFAEGINLCLGDRCELIECCNLIGFSVAVGDGGGR